MDKIYLEWENEEYMEILSLEDSYFYAFVDANNNKILYIGIAYFQDVCDEIDNELREFDLDPDKIIFWLGHISDFSGERITEEFIRDVECLLIFTNQPEINDKCKKNYPGRDMHILNKNFPLLYKNSRCENNEVTYW